MSELMQEADSLRATVAAPRWRSWLVAGIVVAVVALFTQRLSTGYSTYVTRQETRLAIARSVAEDKIARFREETEVVSVGAVNDTGGTFHIFMGENGALQSVGNGIQTIAPPAEVLTLGPHQHGLLIAHDWRNKYVTSQTTYVWLGATGIAPIRLIDASYAMAPGAHAVMVYRAVPNHDDQNYRMTALNGLPTAQAGTNIAAQEDLKIRDFENASQVEASRYPASFSSYAAVLFARITGNRIGQNT